MKERIFRVREESGLTMEKFAAKIGITASSVLRLESGDRKPSNRTIMLICSAFGISEEWLRTGEGQMHIENPVNSLDHLAKTYDMTATELAFFEAYMQLDQQDQKGVMALLEKLAEKKVGPFRIYRGTGDAALDELRDRIDAEILAQTSNNQTDLE